MSFFNLFSSHKYLEKTSGEILLRLAQCDHDNLTEIESLQKDYTAFAEILKGHASWEESFVFIHLPNEQMKQEIESHKSLELDIEAIRKLLLTVQFSPQSLHHCYLSYRKFHLELLDHLYLEETEIVPVLLDKLGGDGLRKIDTPIYQSMSSDDMINMVKELFPPCNYLEKKSILEDLFAANEKSLQESLTKMRQHFANKQYQELLKYFIS